MAKKLSRLSLTNAKLIRDNAKLRAKGDLLERTIHNSLGGLASGLAAGMGDFGGGQAPITSFGQTLSNNMYALITLMWTNLMYLYKTHGLIQTAIDMPVLDALRGGLDLQSDQMDSDDLGLIEDYLEEHSILDRIGDAFIWARLFGGGALVINTESDCEQPIGDEIINGGQIEFYDACRWELSCDRRIPANKKYGFYGKTLDASRVITILGKRAPWLIRAQLSDWGMSEIERMVEDFNLFLRNRNVIYELLEEAKVDVYTLEGFSAQLASSTGTALTTRRIQTMNQIKNFNNALIMDAKDKYEQKQISFGGLAEMMKENRMGIAAALRMPMSKIFGIPASGISGSGEDDIENYNGMIESEVRGPMKPVIRKVLGIVIKNLFGDDLDISFKFKPLRTMSAVEEETVKSSKSVRYLSMFEHMLMNSKEVGEAMQKEGLVPITLQAEQGLLDDHPVPVTQIPGDVKPAVGQKAEAKGDEVVETGDADAAEKKPKATDEVTVENAKEQCFACGKALGANPKLVDTRDGQTAYVGVECAAMVEKAGESGYQPPRGGPKLYPIKNEKMKSRRNKRS